jgi:SAM-dependent methyltransferase
VGADGQWLSVMWPTIRSYLPAPPARIVEIGCGRVGGFVPMLVSSGYQAVGIDPAAPEGESYRREEVERSELPQPVDGVIACTSLHHVADPGEVSDKIAGALGPAGVVIVIEWDWESFDEVTARWCFDRLDPSDSDSWLVHRRDGWSNSGRTWEAYLHGWAEDHGLHRSRRVIDELDQRFQRLSCRRGPFVFPELFETSEADELDAINAGAIRPMRIDYVARVR